MSDEDPEQYPREGRGRSARKRLVRTFDVMALELLEVSEERCHKLPIAEDFRKALIEARTTRSKSARRRHIRHLAGLLRDRDAETEAIRRFLAGEPYVAVVGDESYRDLDALRESLALAEGFAASLEAASHALPHLDLPLVRRLCATLHEGSHDKSYRALYKELRRAADESDRDAEE